VSAPASQIHLLADVSSGAGAWRDGDCPSI